MDDIVGQVPEAEQQLVTWLQAAIRRELASCAAYHASGLMSFAVGSPVVPDDEVWIGTMGVNLNFRVGVATRYPIQAESSARRVTVRMVPNRIGTFINDRVLVEDFFGDSDGDLLFVIAEVPGTPDLVTEEEASALTDVPIELHREIQPTPVEPKEWLEIAQGHKAREATGLVTWQAWVAARIKADLADNPDGVRSAWADVYTNRFSAAIERCMDGRKDGRMFRAEESGILDELPGFNPFPMPGVDVMAIRRNTAPVPTSVSAETLVRQYWSGQLSGTKPVRLEGLEGADAT